MSKAISKNMKITLILLILRAGTQSHVFHTYAAIAHYKDASSLVSPSPQQQPSWQYTEDVKHESYHTVKAQQEKSIVPTGRHVTTFKKSQEQQHFEAKNC